MSEYILSYRVHHHSKYVIRVISRTAFRIWTIIKVLYEYVKTDGIHPLQPEVRSTITRPIGWHDAFVLLDIHHVNFIAGMNLYRLRIGILVLSHLSL